MNRALGSRLRPRAIVGGALCGVAALGLWWAFEQSASTPRTSFAVARSQLTPGHIIESDDIDRIAMHLPAAVEATVFGVDDDVLGNVVTGAVHAGELLTRGDVVAPRLAEGILGGHAVSVSMERSRALNGLVAAGERVDVIATDHNEASGGSLLAESALVVHIDDLSDPGSPAGTITVTLQVPDLNAAISLAAAADVGAITLIRTWSNP